MSAYKSFHPSPHYYYFGGQLPKLKDVLTAVAQSNYRGHMAEDIKRLNKLAEPVRTQKLNAEKNNYLRNLDYNLRRFKQVKRSAQ